MNKKEKEKKIKEIYERENKRVLAELDEMIARDKRENERVMDALDLLILNDTKTTD